MAPYVFNAALLYNPTFLMDCIEAWDDAPPAYTLDIGVLKDDTNIVIEAHPFISCGLYGFTGDDIVIPMTIRANNYVRQKQTDHDIEQTKKELLS